jgi:hypothetical protein
MQTFLPVPNFQESARILDYKRLGKQRVEAAQILKALGIDYPFKNKQPKSNAWVNHPATLMWKDHTNALIYYLNHMIYEWVRRGYNNTMPTLSIEGLIKMPDWIGNNKFHASHRSNLLRKDFNYYSKFGWEEPDNLDYYWPTKEKV